MQPLCEAWAHRVPALVPCQFTFLHEPMAAVRLNYNARYVAPAGSPESNYVRWKDEIRDLFDQFDCRDHTIGVPFDEPLSLSGSFLVSEKPESKDLDNLVKAVLDSMNPSRKKNWSGLRTFLWVDDRQIKRFGNWVSLPSGEPRIEIEVTPLWGRIDPNLHYIEGSSIAKGNGRYILSTSLGYPFQCEVPTGVEQPIGDCRVWVAQSSTDGVHTVVPTPAQAVFYRELVTLPRISDGFVMSVLSNPWEAVVEGLATNNAKLWATEGAKVYRAL